MAMSALNGKAVTTPRFATFEPLKVLYDFDGPRIFTAVDVDEELYLAHWCDDDMSTTRYLVVPTDTAIVAEIEHGEMAVRDALEQPRCWIVDVAISGDIEAVRRVNWGDLPADFLPEPGATLSGSSFAETNAPMQCTGRIRELDKDRFSFDLRDVGGQAAHRTFVFDESLLADVLAALHADHLVTVIGTPDPIRQIVKAVAIRRAPAGGQAQQQSTGP